MSAGVENELTAAFESASDFVQPPAGLAERARAGARRRRRRTFAAAAAAFAAVIAIAGATYAAVGHQHTDAVQQRLDRSGRILATVDYQVTQLALSGKYLYVLAGQNSMLTAYDRATGKPIRRVHLPAVPSYLAVGPGGLVWLAFYPPFPYHPRPALWLLSPDLRLHSAVAAPPSASARFITASVLPVTRTSAWLPQGYGLLRVHMPAPGHSGRATTVAEPGTSLGPSLRMAPGGWSGRLGCRLAVFITNPDGHLVLAGSPSVRFGPSSLTRISYMTSTGTAVWLTAYPLRNGGPATTPLQGPLVRLDARLRPTTPGSVRASPVLARSEEVWSVGDTIWVATGVRGHSLVCFTAGGRIGPVTTLPVSGEVMALAATSTTVYVNAEQPSGSHAPSLITGFPVPASCR